MSNFNDQLNLDSAIFTDPDAGFGESVTYIPKGGTAKTINVYVRRTSPRRLPGMGAVSATQLEVWIPNDATLGVASINVNGDTMLVADRQGGTPTLHTVNEILSQDAGMWHLRVI